MNLGLMHPADGFALAMVVILVFSLGIVVLLAVGIYRSGKRRPSEAEDLIEELRLEEEAERQRQDEQKHPASPTRDEEREPWEKEADWWKK
ncbi:hypothetical protein OKA04_19755 [Luteolibacter flavescens]|uniref:Uncharacterized protein n=1 Tax=Luteolibacter flavescens TaxID=1859460 RepID=A0ABT3FUV2_9BACT|nr:hypothetical protein [Luteolibacter flavescens]MCW1886984.1 hypothetical protein [Luteolibacter flavescens]